MASYSPEPGYAFGRDGRTLDPVMDRYTGADYMKAAPYDPMGVHGTFGLGTDSSVMDFLDEVFQGGYGGTTPPGEFYEGGRMNEMNPDDFIRTQLAGDVVPMRHLPPDYADRLTQPGVYMGTRGAAAINQMGGPSSPYLDLLNILAFPSGRSMAPPIGRR